MKLSAKEDIEAPLAFVSEVMADFEAWERAAMRRGAEVDRLDTLRKPGPGMAWRVGFTYRGKDRKLDIKLLDLEPEQRLNFEFTGRPAEGVLNIELAEMGPRRTRVVATMELKPRTLAARLFFQSLRLAKAKVMRRFALRLSQLGADIEDRYRAKSKS
jgi:carbon monoxide dehydrogenase subunit G